MRYFVVSEYLPKTNVIRITFYQRANGPSELMGIAEIPMLLGMTERSKGVQAKVLSDLTWQIITTPSNENGPTMIGPMVFNKNPFNRTNSSVSIREIE